MKFDYAPAATPVNYERDIVQRPRQRMAGDHGLLPAFLGHAGSQ